MVSRLGKEGEVDGGVVAVAVVVVVVVVVVEAWRMETRGGVFGCRGAIGREHERAWIRGPKQTAEESWRGEGVWLASYAGAGAGAANTGSRISTFRH